ncbi:metallophosphoesterase family protein [Diplocloster agilis]|uniref:metallophosphoesterase family protein n=1 Tax=Diplocloster agilis TaxID=2850323 RepID=UPI0008217658|nr:metallophosphoesterase [Suonthocola fibrivorans]MCU6735688.1 metallophosphoesterase [Suonthocola fibrivorans]SCJ79540.1 Calcineurin-like phosphoesterase [uncultured Clostridium sp.]
MNLTVTFQTPGCADGTFIIKAKGGLAATLYWADETAPIEGWSPLASIPLTPSGQGIFHLTGKRSIPPEATHVLARAIMPDLCRREEFLAPIPTPYRSSFLKKKTSLCVISDLHLTNRPGKIHQALFRASHADLLLLIGDLVNDGLPEQFEMLSHCIQETLPGTPVLPVAGNHDYPISPVPRIPEGLSGYPSFQDHLMQRAKEYGLNWNQDPSGAYAVYTGPLTIIGLSAATHWRKLTFQKERQLTFLEQQLSDRTKNELGIIMCHVPLLAHNPQRKPKTAHPYLAKDKTLQKILDAQEKFIYLSGHTHLSPNIPAGCAEHESAGSRIYINTGSVRPTDLKTNEPLIPSDWKDGTILDLNITEETIEIITKSIQTGTKYPRAYYRFPLPQ